MLTIRVVWFQNKKDSTDAERRELNCFTPDFHEAIARAKKIARDAGASLFTLIEATPVGNAEVL